MAFLAALGWAGTAHAVAQVEPCGGVMVGAIETCEVVDDRCWEWCTPQRSMLACVAEHAESCERQCVAEASPLCIASCQQSCELGCNQAVAAGEVGRSCEDSCNADCGVDCKADCAESEFPELCEVACPYRCATDCADTCDEGVSVGGCEQSCESACLGSCTASASSSCELECQAEAEIECTEGVAEACHERCLGGGALFCDGYYIQTGEDPDACVAALEAEGIGIAGSIAKLDGRDESQGWIAGGCSVHERASVGLSMAVFALFGFGFGTSVLRGRRRE